MADDIDPALRLELEEALKVIQPQIRGLHDLFEIHETPEFDDAFRSFQVIRERRRDLIQAVLHALDKVLETRLALEHDGYPRLDPILVPHPLIDQLLGEVSDINAAANVFTSEPTLKVNLGKPVSKP